MQLNTLEVPVSKKRPSKHRKKHRKTPVFHRFAPGDIPLPTLAELFGPARSPWREKGWPPGAIPLPIQGGDAFLPPRTGVNEACALVSEYLWSQTGVAIPPIFLFFSCPFDQRTRDVTHLSMLAHAAFSWKYGTVLHQDGPRYWHTME
jgi:hypothetical protein